MSDSTAFVSMQAAVQIVDTDDERLAGWYSVTAPNLLGAR